jgi:hypothetical protein
MSTIWIPKNQVTCYIHRRAIGALKTSLALLLMTMVAHADARPNSTPRYDNGICRVFLYKTGHTGPVDVRETPGGKIAAWVAELDFGYSVDIQKFVTVKGKRWVFIRYGGQEDGNSPSGETMYGWVLETFVTCRMHA